jgi:hypothetical protein
MKVCLQNSTAARSELSPVSSALKAGQNRALDRATAPAVDRATWLENLEKYFGKARQIT